MSFGPGRIGLHHGNIAKPVDHDARKAISLGMDQAVEGRDVNPVSQRKRMGQPRLKPALRDFSLRVPIQHPAVDL